MAKAEFKKEVEGKVVESVTIFDMQDGVNDVEVRFQDKTGLSIVLAPAKLVVESVELRSWEKGEGTLIRKLV
jgi:hypothetical protein